MEAKIMQSGFGWAAVLASLTLSAAVAAQEVPSACVEQGALAYDNWTKSDAGGSGLPAGETAGDYVRCKACHGWDMLGTDGGYVRRSRNSSRPNAGAGDGDTTSRVIPAGTVTAEQIMHAGSGRSFAEGSGSWVNLDAGHSADNKAAHANGYTLGNQHPDFSAGGLSADQVDCLVEFLNFADADASAYFADINTSRNPALYTMIDTADAAAGEAFYQDNCSSCHGTDPAGEPPIGVPEGGFLAYLAQDGKFSEFAHKAHWGVPNSAMTRAVIGNPTAQDIADVMLYLQQLGGTGFAMTPGLNGNWWNGMSRSGEGFQLEVSDDGNGGLTFVATFYSYAPMGMMGNSAGNQMFLIAVGPVTGNTANVDVFVTGGGMYGGGLGGAGTESPWGTGTFIADSCGSISMELAPNTAMMGNGFTPLMYDLIRLTTPAVTCP